MDTPIATHALSLQRRLWHRDTYHDTLVTILDTDRDTYRDT